MTYFFGGKSDSENSHQGERRVALWTLALGLAAPSLWAADGGAQSFGFYTNFRGLKLVDQDGKKVRPDRWLGKVVLVNFIFTGCSTTCPVQTRALAQMQRDFSAHLKQAVHLFSLSLDPLQDTPSSLKSFGSHMGVDFNRWTFATGSVDDIEKVTAALRLYRKASDIRKPDDHNTSLWLVDKKGELRMRYAGNPPNVPRLVNEISIIAA